MTLAAVLQPIRDELPASPCRYLLELIINMKAAKAIDQPVPLPLLGADGWSNKLL
jgi:hypothetical protein